MTKVLLSGVVGSRAYGLNGPDSDYDRAAVHLRPTADFLGLKLPQLSDVHQGQVGDDSTSHEVGKFLNLVLACNPTASELLWLPEHCYETVTNEGRDLIRMRSSFLFAKGVRNAYLGYAHAQGKRVRREFATEGRQEKAARHTYRLAVAGMHLWETGELLVRLPGDLRDQCFDFGRKVAAGDVSLLDALLHDAEQVFERPTPLPDNNDVGRDAADRWLRDIRIWNL